MYLILFSEITRERHQELLVNYLRKLPHGQQDKVMRFRRWQDAQLCLLGRLLLYHGLQRLQVSNDTYSNWTFNQYGKPYLPGHSSFFNISHSGNLVVCALGKNDLGIDIEMKCKINVHDFKSQMTLSEWNGIFKAEDTTTAFYKYWTQKEAVIKAHGNGLTIPLKSFEVVKNHTKVGGHEFFLKEIWIDQAYICNLASREFISDALIEVEKVCFIF